MNDEDKQELLMDLARKYIWWKTPADAVAMPERIMAQVMDIGDYLDVQALANQVGEDALREVLVHAQAGQFNERSWAYWNYRLGLGSVDYLAPMPVRSLPPSQQRLWPDLRPATEELVPWLASLGDDSLVTQ